MKYFIFIIVTCVVIAVGVGLYMVGSPKGERLRRFDERRVQDLYTTQSNLVQYWQAKNNLPEKLADLADVTRGVVVLLDPVTGKEYEYKRLTSTTFQLCADFSTVVDVKQLVDKVTPYPAYTEPYGILGTQSWNHNVGHVCFDRAIDPDFFKPNKAM